MQLPVFSAAGTWRALLAPLGSDCALCGERCRGFICEPCEAGLPAHPQRPGAPVLAPFEYRFPVDRLVQRFKYGGDLATGRWLAGRLARHVRHAPRPQAVVAVPLTARKLRERGFNQAVEIARAVAAELALPFSPRALVRLREGPSQAASGRRARQRNLRGAFACAVEVRGRALALVDDVHTTGATTEAVRRVLLRAGAAEVQVWCVARTPSPGAP